MAPGGSGRHQEALEPVMLAPCWTLQDRGRGWACGGPQRGSAAAETPNDREIQHTPAALIGVIAANALQERASINAPIQSSAAEIMRLAMIRLDKKIKDTPSSKFKMLLQIHDELIFEVSKKEVKKFIPIVNSEMSSVISSELHSFSIPLTVDINDGDNWGILR